MKCPKCGAENPDETQFCTRCHNTLRFACPSCKHVQTHGGTCEKCGLDFTKYAFAMLAHGKIQAQHERERQKEKAGVAKQLLLLPITGGWSLIKYFKERLGG